MDDELSKLEAELRRLRPVRLRPEMMTRLEERLAAPSRGKILRYTWAVVPLAAAAAVLLMIAPDRDRVAPTAVNFTATTPAAGAEPAFQPVAAENVLLDACDEGLVMLADGTPARRTRAAYLDTIVWQNPATNASLSWSVPREEIRVVPIVYQ